MFSYPQAEVLSCCKTTPLLYRYVYTDSNCQETIRWILARYIKNQFAAVQEERYWNINKATATLVKLVKTLA